ncbi:LLM class flavin-dependent oxidoreductase [Spirillospora sp. NPDC049652]
MDIGVCLPTTVHDADGDRLVEYARRADRLGFSSLTVTDRIVYDNYDGIVALAAAAAVTERITLVTGILLAAARPSPVEVAKQLASLDRLSNGRLVVGVSAGMRADDYEATGTDHGTRGARLDAMIEQMREVWQGRGPVPGVGPRPVRGDIPIWGGGTSPGALRRAARHGIGWISPGGALPKFTELADEVRRLWAEEDREGAPRLAADCYVSLGPDGAAAADKHLSDFYAFLGPHAQFLVKGAITDEARLREVVDGYAAAGCDELMLLPCTDDPGHLDRMADVTLAGSR